MNTRVDDGCHAWNRNGRLGKIRGNDDATLRPRGRPQHHVLRSAVERPVQRQHFHAPQTRTRFEIADDAANLACAWQKTEHVSAGRAERSVRHVGDRLSWRVRHVERV